jgi:hydrogenase expression/formation protein HypE
MIEPLTCGVPHVPNHVELAHGGGGRKMRHLLESVILPAFDNRLTEAKHDSVVLPIGNERIAYTTDGYVISPMFFPGGDIGKLAIFGTVNDLAAAGAIPKWLSVSFILEEGLPLSELERVVRSMKDAACVARVDIVTGDTKVVDRGKGDGLYVTTSGLGMVPAGVDVRPARVRAGDAVLVTGDIGRHGVAVLSVRKGLAFESPVESDCAPLADMVQALVGGGIDVHCARDATRGGLAAVLLEIASTARVEITVEEDAIPVDPSVAAACELLGLDVLHVANEGRMAVFVSESDASTALDILRGLAVSRNAALIGRVAPDGRAGAVSLRTRFGPERAIDLPAGEPLPRIC